MNQEQVLKTAPNWKYWILFGVIAALALVMFLVPPIPQSQTYHLFADTRSMAGVPDALNVLSNLFFRSWACWVCSSS